MKTRTVVKSLLRIGLVVVVAFLVLGFLTAREFAGPPPLEVPRRGVTLDDVVVVEPGGRRSEHRRLVVAGGSIREISEAEAEGAGPWSGAFVLPGLVDAHAHFPPGFLPGQVELFSFLFLRHGVTGIRVPGDVHPGTSKRARAEVAAGDYAGPRIATCGRFVDGPGPVFASALVVANEAEARDAVDRVADAGYDCVKVYNELDENTLAAIRVAAEARGLPVIGHVPWRLAFEEAPMDDVQHLLGFHRTDGPPGFATSGGWVGVTDERVGEIIEFALENDVAMTSTLVAARRIGDAHEIADDPDDPVRRWLPPWYADALWRRDGLNPINRMGAEDFERVQRAAVRMSSVARRLHRSGVRLRAGTDTFAPLLVPGASLHEELRLYVSGGLTPEEALEIATRGSAGALDTPLLGTLRPGAPADLVIYRRDPTRDLAALDTLLAVVQDGRLYTREMLEAQEARYREEFDGFFQKDVAPRIVRAALGFLLRRTVPSREVDS